MSPIARAYARLNGSAKWIVIALSVMTLLATGAMSYGSLASRVDRNSTDIQQINQKLDRIIDLLAQP